MKIEVRTQKPFPNLRLGNFAFCDSCGFYNMWSAKNKVVNEITHESINKLELFDSLMRINDSSNELVVFIFKINSDTNLKIILNSYRDSFILNPIRFKLTKYEIDNGGDENASTYYLKISLRSILEFLKDCNDLRFEDYKKEFLRELNFVSKSQLGVEMFNKWSRSHTNNYDKEYVSYNFKVHRKILEHFLLHRIKVRFDKNEVYHGKTMIPTDIGSEDIYINLLKDTARLCNISDEIAGEYLKYNILPKPRCECGYCKYDQLEMSTFRMYGSGCPLYGDSIDLARKLVKEIPCNTNKLMLKYMEKSDAN